VTLTLEIRSVVTGGRSGHFTTLNAGGGPQISAVWIGIEGDDIVIGHLTGDTKTRNIARDPRVALTIEAAGSNAIGMSNYLVIYGRARLIEGGAPELLQRFAVVCLGPDVKFPPMSDPPAGHVIHITPERFARVGPWVQ
jgi:PPOX class probable F420-dependent enzyme